MSDQGREFHKLQRALGQIVIDTEDARAAQREQDRAVAAGDMAQSIHAPVVGKVGRVPTMTDVTVSWLHPFLTDVATTQSESVLENPTFTHGIELTSDSFVMVSVQLSSWIRDESSFVVGAVVRVVAWAPEAPKKVRYSGVIHMTFTGYAAPQDDDEEDGD